MLVTACESDDDVLVVFAAASLTDVADAAARQTPTVPTRISVGPSSLLSQQIEQGAPADVFLSAHPMWVDRLVDRGLARGTPVELARGRLVIVGPPGRPAARSAAEALSGDGRIALADPAHVPAGQYAQRAIEAMELWGAVGPRVHPVADVRAALVAVQRGTADAAIVYASDAQAADDLEVVYAFDPEGAPAIRFVAVAVSDHPAAQTWVRQLVGPELRGIWRARGFDLPQP